MSEDLTSNTETEKIGAADAQVTGDAGMPPASDPVDTAPPKKRRGRPPKNPTLNAEPVSGASKPGPKPKAKARAYSPSDFEVMGKQLVGVHHIVAMVTGIPEIIIRDEEGALLAQAVGNVANEYGLEIDGKTGASVQLLMTAAMIYGPRFLAFRARAKQAQSAPAPVASFEVSQANGANAAAH